MAIKVRKYACDGHRFPLYHFMEENIVTLAAVAAVAHWSVVPVAQANADYTSFAYDVTDPYTGDFKSQVETRVGGNAQGQYSLLDADGTKRTVDYAADDLNGFNAVVRKGPAIVSAPVVAAVPAVAAIAPSVIAVWTIAAPAVFSASVPEVAARTLGVSFLYGASTPAVLAASSYAVPTIYSAGYSAVAPAHISYVAPQNFW